MNRHSGHKIALRQLWKDALHEVGPAALFTRAPKLRADEALLCWGKAASSSWNALTRNTPGVTGLVISPASSPLVKGARQLHGNHPIPDLASLAAGGALLEFFDSLHRTGIRRLCVALSGGASSLAWIKPASLSLPDLQQRLRALYASPLTIAELNLRRSRLCGLKRGGAARWLARLAPGVKTRVELISDVLPYGPEIVGSGPFHDGLVPHHVRGSNASLVRAVLARASQGNEAVLSARAGMQGNWSAWVSELVDHARDAILLGLEGLIVWGGEPTLALPPNHNALGGRQTQLAAALAVELAAEIGAGKIELLCGSSDGNDGTSCSGGAWVGGARHARLLGRTRVKRALHAGAQNFASARVLRMLPGALLAPHVTGTNVQDCVILRVSC